MEPYTDQMHLKRVLRGESTAAWTPHTSEALEIIDPMFSPGMGGIAEHPVDQRLRCPVIGCGRYFTMLGRHINTSHRALGGLQRVRKVLDIPPSVRLCAAPWRREKSSVAQRLVMLGIFHSRGRLNHSQPKRAAIGKARSRSWGSVAARNLRDSCDAQLTHVILDLARSLRRAPTQREFIKSDSRGRSKAHQINQVYGSWENALAVCKLKTTPRLYSVEDALTALRAWYDVHGELPSSNDANRQAKAPRLPARATILRVFKTDDWRNAMRMAASLLNIYGGRYGLPIEDKPKEEEAA